MQTPLFSGLGTAVVTPFCKTGIDYPALDALLDAQISQGADAIIICGTTGESVTLEEEEHAECVSFAVQKCAGRVPVIAGCGSNSTAHSIRLSLRAQKAGAQGLLLVTPYYNKCSQTGLIAHYTAIADAVELPILLYNVPTRTCVDISAQTCLTLSAHKNIIGIKETSANLCKIQQIRALCPPDFSIYCGDDNLTLPYLALGAQGTISVASNLFPGQVKELYTRYRAGDVTGAMEQNAYLFPLFSALFCEVNPIPVKTALALLGVCSAEMRLPLSKASEQTIQTLQELLPNYIK